MKSKVALGDLQRVSEIKERVKSKASVAFMFNYIIAVAVINLNYERRVLHSQKQEKELQRIQ